VFENLAAEEEKHITFIQGLIAPYREKPLSPLQIGKAMEEAGFFSTRAQSEALDQTVIEAMVPDLPVLRTAYLNRAATLRSSMRRRPSGFRTKRRKVTADALAVGSGSTKSCSR